MPLPRHPYVLRLADIALDLAEPVPLAAPLGEDLGGGAEQHAEQEDGGDRRRTRRGSAPCRPWRSFDGHTRAARRLSATPEEVMEAVWVAAEMRACVDQADLMRLP